MKGYTDFMAGFSGFPEKNRFANNDMKVIDWDKAKELCLANLTATIEAGLREDWNNTSGTIFENGKFDDGYVYGCSTWATPIVDIDGDEIECWKWESEMPKDKISKGQPDWWMKQNISV